MLEDVLYRCDRSPWSPSEQTDASTIVFVRRGCFRRRVNGVESVLDPATAYLERPGRSSIVEGIVDPRIRYD